MVHVVESRIVKSPAEEWHHIVATGAPAGGLYVSIAFQSDLARLANTEKIRLIIERAEMVRAVEPALISVFVAFQAVIVHHQRPRRDKISGRGSGERRFEIFRALLWPGHIPFARVLSMHQDHRNNNYPDRGGP